VRFARRFVLQSLRSRCSLAFVATRERPLGIGCPFRVSTRLRIAVLVGRSHSAVGPFTSAVWSSWDGRRWSRLNSQSAPLFEFRLPPEYYPASPSRRAATHQLLSWTFAPYSTSGTEGLLHAGFACPLRSALRVWLPSRRFPPFDPAPAFFHTGCAPGIHPSELSPPGRPSVRFRTGETHLPFLPQVKPPTGAGGRPCRPRFLGLSSRESLATGRGFSTSTAGGSPGFLPSRVRSRQPGSGFARSPLTRFAAPRSPGMRPEPQSVDRPSPASARHPTCMHVRASGGTLRGFLHRHIPNIRIRHVSGYCFTSHRVVHYCRPAGDLRDV